MERVSAGNVRVIVARLSRSRSRRSVTQAPRRVAREEDAANDRNESRCQLAVSRVRPSPQRDNDRARAMTMPPPAGEQVCASCFVS